MQIELAGKCHCTFSC